MSIKSIFTSRLKTHNNQRFDHCIPLNFPEICAYPLIINPHIPIGREHDFIKKRIEKTALIHTRKLSQLKPLDANRKLHKNFNRSIQNNLYHRIIKKEIIKVTQTDPNPGMLS